MPSRVEGAAADGVLARRHAEQHDGAHAERGQLGDLLAQALAAVLDDAGQRDDRLRLGDALAHEQRGDQVARAHGRLGDEVTQGRRAAQAARPVDGEREHRASPSWYDAEPAGRTPRQRPVTSRDVGDARGPRAAASRRGHRPDGDEHRRRRTAPSASAHAAAAEPLASSTASALVSVVTLVGRRAGGRPSGRRSTDSTVWPRGGEPVGERRPGPVGLGEEDPAGCRRELGEQPLGLGHAPARGRRRGRRRGERGGRRRADGGQAQRRVAGGGRPGAAAPLADVTTSQSNAASRAERGPQLHAAVGRVADLDQRHVHDRRPELGQPLARARPASGRVMAIAPARSSARSVASRRRRRGRCAGRLRGPARGRRRRARERRRARGRRVVRRRPARNTCSSPPATWAPTGSEQPDPSSARKLRSTSTAWRVGGVVDGGEQLGRRRVVGAGLDGDAALPDGRHEHVAGRGARRSARSCPSTCSAATAITIAPPSGTFDEPGGDVAAQLDERAGRAATAASWARRRTDPVATVAPGGELGRAADRSARRRRRAGAGTRRSTSASCGRRRQVLGRVHGDVGAPVEHGLLDLLDEHALAADHVQRHVLAAVAGRLDEHQLDVAAGGARPAAAATASAWVRACGLPRVARRRRRHAVASVQVEQVAHGGRVALALRRAGVVAEAHGRAVQQLGDDRPGQRLDGVALGVVELGEAAGEAGELAWRASPRRARAAGRRAARPGGR